MLQENILIGKVVKIDGLNITVEITREQDIRKILLQWNIKDYVVSIHNAGLFYPDTTTNMEKP